MTTRDGSQGTGSGRPAWKFLAITAALAEDDELISPEGVRRLYRLYPNAPTRFESLQPHAHGLQRLGHFGLFKPQAATALWPLALTWIAD